MARAIRRPCSGRVGQALESRFPYKIVVRHVLTLGNLPKLAAFDRRLFQRVSRPR
jgi:hypothetical protein